MDGSSHLLSRRKFQVLAACWLASLSSGCGTLLHPEREGQPRTGALDWTVVGMDAIGLIFFFVPGVIAFAIDIYNGTIFYPPEYGSLGAAHHLKTVKLCRPYPSLDDVAEALSGKIGRTVRLRQGNYRTVPLAKIEDFWPTERRFAALRES